MIFQTNPRLIFKCIFLFAFFLGVTVFCLFAKVQPENGRSVFKTAAATQNSEETPEQKGLHNLLRKTYGRPIIDEKTLDNLWTVWEPEWQAKIRDKSDKAEIRRLTLERYGFSNSVDPQSAVPLQFSKSERGLTYNCMTCHSGRLPGAGTPFIGLPNSEIDIATLTEDVMKLAGQERDASFLQMTRGRTNAFKLTHNSFQFANEDISVRKTPLNFGNFGDFDLDAPPWWVLKKKKYLYSDGFVEGGFERAIMQFAMHSTDAATFRSWETDFKEILAYLLSIEPPKYPWAIDEKLARDGKRVFEQTCSQCHGTYGAGGEYPNRIVPVEVVGTDATRLRGVTTEFRNYYARTWIGQNSKITEKPVGYIAPPLDGIWASAPYFHNGSVPSVYGVLTEKARPTYFRRINAPAGYDRKNLGIQVETLKNAESMKNLSRADRRRVIDTTQPGLGNQGHPFGFRLTEKEKRQVIEYLKTL